MATTQPTETIKRINDLHLWYQRNVMDIRLTAEVERLWFEWLKDGYNGTDLRDVVRYIRRQILCGKRNEGALKLSNLFTRSEGGAFLKFNEDLALSRAKLSPDRKLEPAPDSPVKQKQTTKPTITNDREVTKEDWDKWRNDTNI